MLLSEDLRRRHIPLQFWFLFGEFEDANCGIPALVRRLPLRLAARGRMRRGFSGLP
jgi:hypothetical protein